MLESPIPTTSPGTVELVGAVAPCLIVPNTLRLEEIGQKNRSQTWGFAAASSLLSAPRIL